jgi:hypothetical protein
MTADLELKIDGESALPTSPSESLAIPNAAALTEDLALARLKQSHLTDGDVDQIARVDGLMKSRKVRIAIASHPRSPRRLALRLIRELFTFELVQFAMAPAVAADLRRVADEVLLSRLASISLGERISLARRSSQRVAGALLLDKEKVVWQPALENPRLTEASVVKAVQRSSCAPALVEAISHHAKWSVRLEIRSALLRSPHTPFARAIEFARRIPPGTLRDILHTSLLPENTKAYLRKSLEAKGK